MISFHEKNGEVDKERVEGIERSWGIKMGKMEELYYEDMKSERKMECGRGVDPVWHQAIMRRQRERERMEEYRLERDKQFECKSIQDIECLINEDGSFSLSSGEEGPPAKSQRADHGDGEEDSDTSKLGELTLEEAVGEGIAKRKRRKKFAQTNQGSDPAPEKYRHLRESERKVKDKALISIGNLVGEGLSLNEASKSLVEVGNVLFDRKWKQSNEATETFDLDTLPEPRNIREAIKMQEAQDLDLMVDELEAGKEAGKPLTHFSDSTTKARVSQSVAQGIHVGRDPPFPLPILSIDGETTEDIAMQVNWIWLSSVSHHDHRQHHQQHDHHCHHCHPNELDVCQLSKVDMALTLVAVVRGVESKEIYKLIDTHITDATGHNKGLAEVLAEMYDLDTKAGQLFCSSHTTLGMSSAMNKFLRLLGGEMKMDELVKTFMMDLEFDSKNGSVAGHSIDMCLRLVAPEYNAKPWNKNKQFLEFLEERGAHAVLFSYKDNRFGCLPRAAAVLLFHWEHLREFLVVNPDINNRLACLVREVMNLPYLQPVLAVLACLGVHLVEPFYANTISTSFAHSSLKTFFIDLYKSMEEEPDNDFFTFANPSFRGVDWDLFEGVKVSYKQEVLSVVTRVASEHKEDVINLAKGILPHLRTVLARQR